MDALLLAVINALWQGAALIALVALALRAGLRRNATTACVAWSITFLVVALLPALDLALARPAVTQATSVAVAPARETLRDEARMTAIVSATTTDPLGAASFARTSAPVDRTAIVRDGALRLGGVATAFARGWGIALLGAWALVAGVLLLRLGRGFAAVAQMKRDATPLDEPLVLALLAAAGHRRRATVARSLLVDVPCAVGFRRPMILIPDRLATSLDADDLARVVLHESAHLQRYDDWLNAFEQIVCALQFFQPALYVARRGIDFEREVACDDRVLQAAGEPLRYAECLARIVQRSVRGPRVAVAPGFVLRRAQVVGRVRRIVDRSRDASPRLRFAAVALTAVVLAATLGIARLQVPVVTAASAAPAEPPALDDPRTIRLPATHAHAAHVARVARVAHPAHATHVATFTHAEIAHQAHVVHLTHPTAHVVAARTAVRAATPAPARTPCMMPDDPGPAAPPARPAPRGDSVTAPMSTAVSAVTESVTRIAPVAMRMSFQASFPAAPAPRAYVGSPPAARSGGDLLDAIDEAKYPHPSVDELIALRNEGISADYVRRMGALHPRPTLHDLQALADQGVTSDYVAVLNRRLAAEPSIRQIISLRDQGVSAAWLDGLGAIGYPKLSADDAANLTAQGVSVAYVRGLLDAGLRSITPSQIVALRVQGIDGSYVRRLAAHNYKNLSIDELIRLKVAGFEP